MARQQQTRLLMLSFQALTPCWSGCPSFCRPRASPASNRWHFKGERTCWGPLSRLWRPPADHSSVLIDRSLEPRKSVEPEVPAALLLPFLW